MFKSFRAKKSLEFLCLPRANLSWLFSLQTNLPRPLPIRQVTVMKIYCPAGRSTCSGWLNGPFLSPDYFKISTLSGNAAIAVLQFVASCCQMKIEGLHAKRAYIEFWPIFIFCRIELILADWLVLIWKASFRNCFGRFVLRSPEITYAERLSFAWSGILMSESFEGRFWRDANLNDYF